MPIKSVLDATNLGAENVMSKSHVDDHGSGTRSTARVGACLLIALTSACQEAPETSATARSADAPTLVVLMAVDQLRADLLDRYDTLFVDRKSTRLNSSHANISYAVFCLKKKIPKK